jgi:hypothetical protein
MAYDEELARRVRAVIARWPRVLGAAAGRGRARAAAEAAEAAEAIEEARAAVTGL